MIEIKDSQTLANLAKEMAANPANITCIKWGFDEETYETGYQVTFNNITFSYNRWTAGNAYRLSVLTSEEKKTLDHRFNELQKQVIDVFGNEIVPEKPNIIEAALSGNLGQNS